MSLSQVVWVWCVSFQNGNITGKRWPGFTFPADCFLPAILWEQQWRDAILTSCCCNIGRLHGFNGCSLYMKPQHPVLTVTSSSSDCICILVFYLGLLHSCSVLCICLYLMGGTCNAGERLDLVLVWTELQPSVSALVYWCSLDDWEASWQLQFLQKETKGQK